MIGTDCIGSCKSNYPTITTTTGPVQQLAILLIDDVSIYRTVVPCIKFLIIKDVIVYPLLQVFNKIYLKQAAPLLLNVFVIKDYEYNISVYSLGGVLITKSY
jgi:hypothetical protein